MRLTVRDTTTSSCSDVSVDWTYEILPGLPGTGPYPEQFSTQGGTHREGFVVRFTSSEGESWVGNFQPYYRTYLSGVFSHPAGHNFVVLAYGQGYVVDPATRRLIEAVGPGLCAAAHDDSRLVLATDTEAIVIERGTRWVSERLAWDGIAALRIEGDRLVGQGRDALIDDFREIALDLQSHAVLKSAYEFEVVALRPRWRDRLRSTWGRLRK
jgi:hypothetical protein